MGRRSEQRIVINFPVTLRGTDAGGTAFTANAQTIDISFSGASLQGVSIPIATGAKLELQCRDQSAWYRVQWVGRGHGAIGGRIGLRCLEIGKYIWGVPPKEWEADTYDPANPPPPSPSPVAAHSVAPLSGWYGNERRQFARHDCCIEAQVFLERDPSPIAGKVIDISLGGCYFQMLSPLPVGASIRIALNAGDSPLNLNGKVRSSQAGQGMGVAFTGMGPDDFERLRKLAPPTTGESRSGHAQPPPAAMNRGNSVVPPQAAPATYADSRSYAAADDASIDLSSPDTLDALVRLLLRKGIFTRAELAEELEKLKFTLS
jgi:PilZ domain